MSYFASAEEAAHRLELSLLLEAETDPRFLERHTRLSRFAVPTPQAARLYHRLTVALADAKVGFSAAAGGALWVAGPSGSLEHLPWAVGLSDHLARSGGLVGISDRSGTGPLPALASDGQRRRVASSAAEMVHGGAVVAVATDLAGVRIVDRAAAAEATANPTAVIPWLVICDPLPELLEGPYPAPTGLLGTILAAAYRDHSSRELLAIVQGLRAAGHRLLGLVALGPAVASTATTPGRRDWTSMTGLPVPRLRPEQRAELPAASPEPTAAPIPQSPPEPAPEYQPEPVPEPMSKSQARPEPAASPEAERSPAPTVSPLPEPSPAPAAAEAPADAPAAPPADPSSSPPEAPSGAPLTPSEPPRVPLLSTWDAQVRRDDRRRRGGGAFLGIAVSIGVALVVYQFFLRPSGVRLPSSPSAQSADSLTTAVTATSGGPDSAIVTTVGPIQEPTAVDSSRDRAIETLPVTASGDSATPVSFPTSLPASRASETGSAPGSAQEDTSRVRPRGASPTSTSTSTSAELPEAVGPPEPALREPVSATPPAARPEPIPAEPPSRLEPAETVGEPSTAGYVIHLSSYKLESEAAAEAAELVRQGVAARTLRVDVPDRGTWYRIVTGDFVSFAQAESAALALQARGVIPYVHIAANGGRGTPIPVGTLDRIRP